jgi:hypothetical protein
LLCVHNNSELAVSIDEKRAKEWSEEVNHIIGSRQVHIIKNYPLIQDAYQSHYNDPELDPLRNEICLCLIFGFYQAAITLTNHFLEWLLKYSLMVADSRTADDEIAKVQENPPRVQEIIDHFEDARKTYESANLSSNIDAAFGIDLVTKKEKETLHRIREDFRNAMSHADKGKTYPGTTITSTAIRMADGKLELGRPETIPLAHLLIGQGIAQAEWAEANALDYFLYMDAIARRILTRLYGKDHLKSDDLTGNA